MSFDRFFMSKVKLFYVQSDRFHPYSRGLNYKRGRPGKVEGRMNVDEPEGKYWDWEGLLLNNY